MDALQANALLTKAALIDPRLRRTNPRDQAEMADTWSQLLHDVPLSDAETAMMALLRRMQGGDAPILPGDVLTELGVLGQETVVDLTPRALEVDKRRKLAAAGVTVQDVLDHQDDAAWLADHFPERGPSCPRCGGSGSIGWGGVEAECDLCGGLGVMRAAIDA